MIGKKKSGKGNPPFGRKNAPKSKWGKPITAKVDYFNPHNFGVAFVILLAITAVVLIGVNLVGKGNSGMR